MTSLRTRVSDTLGRLLFREVAVTGATTPAPGFRHLTIAAPTLRGLAIAAGDKLQLAVPAAGLRTYTPFAVDRARGQLELLVHLHGAGPAARWAAEVEPGATIRAFGPRRSLEFGVVRGPVLLVGDATSIGLARALVDGGHPLRVVLEASDPDAARCALARVAGVDGAVVPAGRLAALDAELQRALRDLAPPTVVLTGNARTIAVVRASLRAAPVAGRAVVTRAYWADGKRGLD
ncbi:MAG: siderophore-interacting protein [Kofleriaceae bacterium]